MEQIRGESAVGGKEMYSELKTSIQSVYQKTGIDVFLFSPEGKFLFSAAGEKPPFAFRRFGGVL